MLAEASHSLTLAATMDESAAELRLFFARGEVRAFR